MDNRELDALVVVHIFNWRWMQYPAPNSSQTVWKTGLFPPEAPNRICVANGYDRIWRPSTSDAPRFRDWDKCPWWEDDEFRRGFPCYSTDMAAVWAVEEHIKERGLVKEYIDALSDMLAPDDDFVSYDGIEWATYDGLWALIHATPQQRCTAALKAVGIDVSELEAA